MSKQEYSHLTETEKMFIRKEYESKLVNEMTHMRNAVLNAVNNAMRKKGKSFIELFKKKNEKADKEYNERAIKIIIDMEKKQGKSWVNKIYEANGIKIQQKEGD